MSGSEPAHTPEAQPAHSWQDSATTDNQQPRPAVAVRPGPDTHSIDSKADNGEPDDNGPAAIHQKRAAMRAARALLAPAPTADRHSRPVTALPRTQPPATRGGLAQPVAAQHTRSEVPGVSHAIGRATRPRHRDLQQAEVKAILSFLYSSSAAFAIAPFPHCLSRRSSEAPPKVHQQR